MLSKFSSWFERAEKRRQELAEGVDANLVRANRIRHRAGLALLFLAVVLGFLKTLSSSYAVRMLFIWGAGAFFLVGIVVARRAMLEDTFLNKPDPEGPPKLFDDLK